jgi:hypothetical protein
MKDIRQSAPIVCSEIANDRAPILYAERSQPEDEADSGWQFLCGSPSENWQTAQVWAVHEVLELEPTLKPFVDFPVGTVLQRASPESAWQIKGPTTA